MAAVCIVYFYFCRNCNHDFSRYAIKTLLRHALTEPKGASCPRCGHRGSYVRAASSE